MKTWLTLIGGIGFLALAAGCVTVSEIHFSLNTDTGVLTREYFDLASLRNANEKDYSVSNDWGVLKRLVADKKPEFNPEVVAEVSKTLYERDGVLCGNRSQRIGAPKAFPSKAAMLAYVHDKDWRFETINEEIVCFVPQGKTIRSSNGQLVKTAKNTMIIWPQDISIFEYVMGEPYAGATSLLPYFKMDTKESNAPAGQ